VKDIVIGHVADFADGDRRVLVVDGVEIGVFREHGRFMAYLNRCPHLGGPACQGLILPRTIEDLRVDNVDVARSFSRSEKTVVCPWHGMEFDIATGEHVTSAKLRLAKVPLRVENDEIIVTMDRKADVAAIAH
jgi:nitrite reductase/ring-hydroxylating ferredoxin subunit